MEPTASAIMSHPAICARENMTVAELMDLLQDRQISGVPVVNTEDRLVGVISITDLLALETEDNDEALTGGSDYHTSPAMDGLAAADGLLQPAEEIRDCPIATLMSRHVITTTEEAPLGKLADLLLSHRIHRLVIVREDRIAGIVSVRDILRALQDRYHDQT